MIADLKEILSSLRSAKANHLKRYDGLVGNALDTNIARVEKMLREQGVCLQCGHIADHEACNGRVE